MSEQPSGLSPVSMLDSIKQQSPPKASPDAAAGRSDAQLLRNIQALRAIAVLGVVHTHLADESIRAGWPRFGGSGVDLFFVISGLIMVITVRERERNPALFLKSRLTRIVPIYWLMTLVTITLAALFPAVFKSTRPDIEALLKSLFFIPFSKAGGFPQPVLFVGWSLNYEMYFYICFTAGLLLQKLRYGLLLTTAMILTPVITRQFVQSPDLYLAFYGRPVVMEFIGGMAVAAMMGLFPKAMPAVVKPVLLLALLAALAAAAITPAFFHDVESAYTAGVFAILVVAIAVMLERYGWSTRSRLVAPHW